MTRRLVALLFEFSTLNGGERSMLAAVDWLRGNGAEFEFIAIGPSLGQLADAFRQRGIPLVGWSPNENSGLRRSPAEIEASLCQVFGCIGSQLVHGNSLAMGRLLGRIAGQLEVSTTAHLRDIVKLSAAAIADLNRNRKLIAVSNATRDFHVGQGIDERRVTVVRNGVDLDQFRPRARSGWLHTELQLRREMNDAASPDCAFQELSFRDEREVLASPADERPAKLIASIGQIGLRKGLDVLAAAAPIIVEKVADAHFVLVGARTSQKQESIEFEQAIHRSFAGAGLSDRLHALGPRDDVADLLGEIDLLVHPANQEPFGRVLLEASAAAVPIVATDVGGTSEIVVHGVTGRLIPARNPQALADAVVAILTDESEAQRLRIAARARAEREFSITIAAESLAKVWNGVLNHEEV